MRLEHFDFIIVGAGTAGCVLTSRLSEHPDLSVLLLEAGPHYRTMTDFPSALRQSEIMSASLPTDPHNWGFTGQLRPGARQSAPRGKVVGGSSAINGCLFVRGTPQDFDDWASRGNDLWSYREVLPFFRKLETDHDFGGDALHGRDGPMPVSRLARDRWPATAAAFFFACRDKGFAELADMNGAAATGVGAVPINSVDGLRMNTATTYLSPALSRPNLTVRGDTNVTRILFDGRRAIGVEANSAGGKVVFNGGQILLCAGAIMSPCLLMRSGVGPADRLRQFSIPVVRDVPNVGRNASDHCSARVSFRVWRRPPPDLTRFSNPVALSLATSEAESQGDIQISLFSTPPNERLLHGLSRWQRLRMLAKSARAMSWSRLLKQATRGGDLALACTLMAGRSRGEVTLASADPAQKPLINHNFLADPYDLARLRAGVRVAVELLEQAAFRDLGARRTAPGPTDLSSDDALDRWILSNVTASAHLSGTCRMGPVSDDTAVVDQHCCVHGIDGLRVVDASIMPAITSRGPYPTTIMIGERVAALIAR